MRTLQDAEPGFTLYSHEYHYKLDEVERISFIFNVTRKAIGSKYAGFGMLIKECPEREFRGQLSVIVDSLSWCKNQWPLNKMKKESYAGFFAFDDELAAKADLLVIRAAIHFSN